MREVCREHEIAETLYYGWRDKLLEGGKGMPLSSAATERGTQDSDLESPVAPVLETSDLFSRRPPRSGTF